MQRGRRKMRSCHTNIIPVSCFALSQRFQVVNNSHFRPMAILFSQGMLWPDLTHSSPGSTGAPPWTQPQTLTRRLFLAGTAAGRPGCWPSGSLAPGRRPRPPPVTTVHLGVASGDPTPTASTLDPAGPPALRPRRRHAPRAVPVDSEVATGPRFREVVRRGRSAATPARAHAVHVEVDGLDPGPHYWYRFRAGGHLSRVGRTGPAPTRAAPSAARPGGGLLPELESGFYTAYRHLAEDDVDLVLHLGTTSMRRPGGPAPHPFGGRRPTWPATGSATPCTRPTATSRPPTPATRSWSPSTTTRSRTTTPAATPPRTATRPPSCAAGRPPTAAWEHLPLRHPPRGATMPCTDGCASATWPRSTC